MTVQELIEKLLELPRDYEVKLANGPDSDDVYGILSIYESGDLAFPKGEQLPKPKTVWIDIYNEFEPEE